MEQRTGVVSVATAMPFSAQLEAKFQMLLKRYPITRSALIPILLYAQDEHGYLSKEMIAEIPDAA